MKKDISELQHYHTADQTFYTEQEIILKYGHKKQSLPQLKSKHSYPASSEFVDQDIYPKEVTKFSEIRTYCLQECLFDPDSKHLSYKEVRECRCFDCPFWPYRHGSNPFHKNGKK